MFKKNIKKQLEIALEDAAIIGKNGRDEEECTEDGINMVNIDLLDVANKMIEKDKWDEKLERLSEDIKNYSSFSERISKLLKNFRYRFYLLTILNKNKILRPWDVILFVFKNTYKMESDANWRIFCKTKDFETVCSQSILQK